VRVTHTSQIDAEICAATDRQLANQAMLGLASSKFREWSRDGRDVLAKIEEAKI
jgi:hypothetical protein